MEITAMSVGMTIADLDAQEASLTQRRDAYVQEANSNIAHFNGAIMHVQEQRKMLVRQHEAAAAEAEKGKKPRRGKVAKKTPDVAPAVG